MELSQKRLLTTKNVCEMLNCSRTTMWRRISAGQVPKPIKINSRNYWQAFAVEEHLDQIMGVQ